MKISTIKKGSRGPLVRMWQNFLLDEGFYTEEVDGLFGPVTVQATEAFQKQQKLIADGIVGNHTWGAAMALGLELISGSGKGNKGPNWPPRPTFLRPASLAKRQKLFGNFLYQPAPRKSNPEGIRILGNWQKENIRHVTVPQLKGVYGAPKSGRVLWHQAAKDQLRGLFQAWEDEGLIHLVKSWAGSWNPRFVRGSRSVLSNHAHATAFDINVPGNRFGRRPALVGEEYSVRLLVPIAHEFGFWWGGHGWPPSYERKDGMHFEVCRII
jgi:peptidoglycan hydrolase-like protein with peptidoglycan-binding domain